MAPWVDTTNNTVGAMYIWDYVYMYICLLIMYVNDFNFIMFYNKRKHAARTAKTMHIILLIKILHLNLLYICKTNLTR